MIINSYLQKIVFIYRDKKNIKEKNQLMDLFRLGTDQIINLYLDHSVHTKYITKHLTIEKYKALRNITDSILGKTI